MGSYATRDDVYLLGLSAQAFVVRPRPVQPSDVDISTGTIRLKAHGLTSSDVISLEVTSGGSLPTGTSAFAAYSATVITSDLFCIVGFSSFAAAGSGWGVVVDPGRRIDAHLVETAAEIDEHLTAHEPPIQPDPVTGELPQILVGMNARMAARAAVTSLQIENPAYKIAVDRLMAREEFDKLILADWKNGKPVHPVPTDETVVADNGARASYSRPSVCWTTGRL